MSRHLTASSNSVKLAITAIQLAIYFYSYMKRTCDIILLKIVSGIKINADFHIQQDKAIVPLGLSK